MSHTSVAYYTGRETQKAITTQVIPIAFTGQQTVKVPINVSYPVGRIVFKPINLSNLSYTAAGASFIGSQQQEPLMVFSSLIDNSCCGITGVFVQVASNGAAGTLALSGYAITMPNDIVTQFKAPRMINGNYEFSLGSQLNGGAWAAGVTNAAGATIANGQTPTSVFYGAITVQIEFLEY